MIARLFAFVPPSIGRRPFRRSARYRAEQCLLRLFYNAVYTFLRICLFSFSFVQSSRSTGNLIGLSIIHPFAGKMVYNFYYLGYLFRSFIFRCLFFLTVDFDVLLRNTIMHTLYTRNDYIA